MIVHHNLKAELYIHNMTDSMKQQKTAAANITKTKNMPIYQPNSAQL